MSQSVQNFAVLQTEGPNNTVAFTIGAGVHRKLILGFAGEGSVTWASVSGTPTFNGSAMTFVITQQNSSNGFSAFWYYDIPDALGAGAYNAVYAFANLGTEGATVYGWQTLNSALGAPEAYDSVVVSSGSNVVSKALIQSAGALLIAVNNCSSATPTWTWSGDVTLRQNELETDYHSGCADAINAAGTKTATDTGSTTSGGKVMVVMSIAEFGVVSSSRGYVSDLFAGAPALKGPQGLPAQGFRAQGSTKLPPGPTPPGRVEYLSNRPIFASSRMPLGLPGGPWGFVAEAQRATGSQFTLPPIPEAHGEKNFLTRYRAGID